MLLLEDAKYLIPNIYEKTGPRWGLRHGPTGGLVEKVQSIVFDFNELRVTFMKDRKNIVLTGIQEEIT